VTTSSVAVVAWLLIYQPHHALSLALAVLALASNVLLFVAAFVFLSKVAWIKQRLLSTRPATWSLEILELLIVLNFGLNSACLLFGQKHPWPAVPSLASLHVIVLALPVRSRFSWVVLCIVGVLHPLSLHTQQQLSFFELSMVATAMSTLTLFLWLRRRYTEGCRRLSFLRELQVQRLIRQIEEERQVCVSREKAVLHLEHHFVMVVWHAVRTPLNGAAGCLRCMATEHEALMRSPPSAQTASALFHSLSSRSVELDSCVQEALQFLTELGALYRIDAGNTVVTPVCENLNSLLILAYCSKMAGKQPAVELEVDLPTAPLWVMVDASLLRQVVLNLLSNAMRLTRAGFVRLRCKEQRTLADGKVEVFIEVADSGPGLPPERLAQLTKRYGLSVGSGDLGLHVTSRMLMCLGSELQAASPYSEPGRSQGAEEGPGVALSFVLCVERAAPKEVQEVVQANATALPAQLRVLVADDVSLNRRMLRMSFKHICPEWQVVEAATAEEAVELARAAATAGEPFGLICIDEEFAPGVSGSDELMRGSEAVRLIREHERKTQASAAIVSITGNALFRCEGANAAWGKPFPSPRDGTMQHELAYLLCTPIHLRRPPRAALIRTPSQTSQL